MALLAVGKLSPLSSLIWLMLVSRRKPAGHAHEVLADGLQQQGRIGR
jgi:hypothetical protein